MNPKTASQWIELQAADGGRFKAYLSLPPAPKGPGVLLIQEIFGVNRHIKAVADQYAMDGFVVLAPDVFWRIEPGLDIGYSDADKEHGYALKQRLDMATTVRDLGAAASALRARPECTGRVACLGYCMGGLLSYLCAAGGGVDAAVCYYGGGIQAQLEQAASIRSPILLHFAENDHIISMQAVDSVRRAFKDRANAAVHVYPGASHGFNCWDRAAYEPMSAALAHGRTLEFLATAIG